MTRQTPVLFQPGEEQMPEVAQYPISTQPPAPQQAAFGGIIRTAQPAPTKGNPDFVAIHGSPEFTALRRRFRRFVFPMSALFFLWYLTYVLLAAYAPGFMSYRLTGALNVGLVLGLLQFVSTLAITAGYLRFARRRLDPAVAAIRARAGAARK
jgi:uncharacterized membrane protein (DUF485 family)